MLIIWVGTVLSCVPSDGLTRSCPPNDISKIFCAFVIMYKLVFLPLLVQFIKHTAR